MRLPRVRTPVLQEVELLSVDAPDSGGVVFRFSARMECAVKGFMRLPWLRPIIPLVRPTRQGAQQNTRTEQQRQFGGKAVDADNLLEIREPLRVNALGARGRI